MERTTKWELIPAHFGPLWSYVEDDEITDIDFNGRDLWITNTARYIDSSYYLKSYENGGLESTSKWKSEVTYKDTLEAAMNNVKGEDGNWSHTVQTWEFSKEDIEQVKHYVNNNGMGNSKYQYNIMEVLDIFKANKNHCA